MKVICLVPSITETLIEAGVNVVGRTRFCIHPADKVKAIPIVGGTKDIDWNKINSLGADILLLDKEENPKLIAEESPIVYIAIHIQDITSCIASLRQLSKDLKAPVLNDYALRFEKLKPNKIPLDNLIQWVHRPPNPNEKLEYIIWRNPIMAVGKNTFIGSVLEYLGHELPLYESKYPKLSETLNKEVTYLFSTEPYPFLKHKDWILSCAVPSGLVDGESFSWFGVRSLRFLEDMLNDFYYDEQGLVVFTTGYHLRRGYCCKSGCRHCPYGFNTAQSNPSARR